ncbi:hypothetical protein [Pseudomonas sp. BMS12]|uniref:hypothetical protein n=1 Tax=Pseudomonas sp. BMS12 TaxID=1796033 RepID=UPI000ADE1887|nr:hypothetical protein [Pseudomonas sp. BMS12]
MSTAADFAKVAAKQAEEMIASLPVEEQRLLAASAANGCRLSVSFVVQPGSSLPGVIQLSAVDDYGSHHVVLSLRVNVAQRH